MDELSLPLRTCHPYLESGSGMVVGRHDVETVKSVSTSSQQDAESLQRMILLVPRACVRLSTTSFSLLNLPPSVASGKA